MLTTPNGTTTTPNMVAIQGIVRQRRRSPMIPISTSNM
jgi:hypothetical protein